METTESTTSNDLLSAEEWQGLYQRAVGWQSNLAFHKDELRFFKDIIDKYFILLISDAKLDEMRKMTVETTEKEKEVQKLTAACNTLFHDIGDFIDLKADHNEEALLEEFNAVDKECKDFENSFKNLKTWVFTITEHMMETEKLKHLLNA